MNWVERKTRIGGGPDVFPFQFVWEACFPELVKLPIAICYLKGGRPPPPVISNLALMRSSAGDVVLFKSLRVYSKQLLNELQVMSQSDNRPNSTRTDDNCKASKSRSYDPFMFGSRLGCSAKLIELSLY